ncbi:MAG: VOC family protein [Pseudomonadota bacterium]
MCFFDHIAFTAATRVTGRSAFQAETGIELPLGGEHPLMGTHNCVSSMGDDTFLELITIDPTAPAPQHKRWFGLDDQPKNQKLSAHAVVLRSNDLDRDLDAIKTIGVDLGTPLPLTRGELSWRFAVRDDGAIPLDGAAPMLMQWDTATPHPTANMQDQGIRLTSVQISTPHVARLSDIYAALGYTEINITSGETHLSCTLDINGTQVTL